MIVPFESAGEGTPAAQVNQERRQEGRIAAKASVRPGDEQVMLWLEEYTRLRDCAPGGRRNTSAAGGTAAREPKDNSIELDGLKARIAGHYTGLVESIARRFAHSGEPLEDLVQEGYLGLLSALNNYDGGKGVKFSTYATHFIAGAMRHCLRDRGKIIKEPAWLHELSGKINRTNDALTQTLGRPPHTSEVAVALNLTEEAVEEIISTRQVFQVASFDSDPDSDAAGLVDPEKIKSDKYVTLQLPIEDRIVLEAAVDKLKALEQKVLYEFFYKDLNQTEIARKFDISCNYVSHILKNSTKKLRRILGEAEVTDRGRVRTASIVDPVTGLYTAGHIQGRLEEEISRAARGGYPLAVVVIDLEGLPSPGRQRDDMLAECGARVRESIRRVDMAGRFSQIQGDESLLVLLPHTGATAGMVLARLQEMLKTVGAKFGETLTVRVGCALFPEQGRTSKALVTCARSEEESVEELREAA